MRSASILFIAILVAGCATYTASRLEQRFGTPHPRERTVETVPAGVPDYWTDVKPVLESRCVVCHACYDAPCQLKLDSIEGVERGATSARVYHSSRLSAAPLTRLFEDASSVPQWRDKGFFPVLNEYTNTPEAVEQADIMHRLLSLKSHNPLPPNKLLNSEFDLSLNREESCARPETIASFDRKHPLWGMPYALPGLDADEQQVLLDWLEAGAPYTPRNDPGPELQNRVTLWEKFLNEDSPKSRLMSRYIYEHLFLASLHFPEVNSDHFFKLVRSATSPGKPVEIIATRRPYSDPGVSRVYYRIIPELGSTIAKTHMPYALDDERMDNWRRWFIDVQYSPGKLPDYEGKNASNPFRTFDAMPVQSRYRFLLDEAQFTIMSFIKGPVCRGQVALNVINDHFWVFFIDPDYPRIELMEEFLSNLGENMELPASTEDTLRPIHHWKRYAAEEKALLARTDDYLAEHLSDAGDIDLNMVWDGGGTNDNAALTVFRHFDSASVEKGLVGAPPKTAWLIGYALLERIHYLLVAGYDIYGNLGHQLLSRVYMDFLRMEGEIGFLILLPDAARENERQYWYRGADESVMEFLRLPRFESRMDSSIEYQTNSEKEELFSKLHKRLKPALPDRFSIDVVENPDLGRALQQLDNLAGSAVTLMPQVSFLEIADGENVHHATILRNNAHYNITSLFGETKFRKPDEDRLTAVPGFIGTYPNVFFEIAGPDLGRFTARVKAMQDEQDYERLVDDFGVRRTDPDFWKRTDSFQSAYLDWGGVEAGILDFGRVENR